MNLEKAEFLSEDSNIYIFNGSNFYRAVVRTLSYDDVTDMYVVTYHTHSEEFHAGNWDALEDKFDSNTRNIYLDPKDPSFFMGGYEHPFISCIRLNVTDGDGDFFDEWAGLCKACPAYASLVPESVIAAARGIYEGKSFSLNGVTVSPVGEWVTEENRPDGCIWDGTDWYLLVDVKIE